MVLGGGRPRAHGRAPQSTQAALPAAPRCKRARQEGPDEANPGHVPYLSEPGRIPHRGDRMAVAAWTSAALDGATEPSGRRSTSSKPTRVS